MSGLTVMIALGGLFLTGESVFTGVAIGAITVVGVAVAGSLTFLPALLSWLGPWADRARVPWLGRRRTAAGPSRLWAALVRRVVRRPAVWGTVAALAMLALAAPAVGLRLGDPPNGGFPANQPIIKALPSTLGQAGGLTYNVAGGAAGSHDDIAALHSRTPLVLAMVAALAFLLLLLAFRFVFLRPVDGLPRVHPEPDPRAARPGRQHP